MTTKYNVVADSQRYIVVARMKVDAVSCPTLQVAEEVASEFRRQGMEATIFTEWDLTALSTVQLLLPLVSSSTTQNEPDKQSPSPQTGA